MRHESGRARIDQAVSGSHEWAKSGSGVVFGLESLDLIEPLPENDSRTPCILSVRRSHLRYVATDSPVSRTHPSIALMSSASARPGGTSNSRSRA
jgi:hypothetical protein